MTESAQTVSQDDTFHRGELIAQQHVGVREKMAGIGPRVIRDYMPDQHRDFFEQLRFLLVGSRDDTGQPWASMLVGEVGFVSSPTERQLQVRAHAHPSDPLNENLHDGAALGLLGIEPHTRRRNRANGIVERVSDAGFLINITESFGNCPKYIQARRPALISLDSTVSVREEIGTVLTPAMAALISRADTFFIATAADENARHVGGRHGTDVSHRGGKPGFVRVDGDHTLTVPDFVGNFFFNTIGNLVTYPRAGLLFVDFSNGDLLYVAVTGKVIWDGPEVESFTGAQRLMQFSVSQARHVRSALPLRWSDAEPSPYLEPLGSWK
ncbi:flavin-nucleotide-binding protein [Herbaspirillum sp. meg3]|uniref:pyridoxamine 5'-phosphate oxidase family protein n=1 Tax=Herbaspirillum sp. meg3 TaxID=2025949 RepID=UPI000B99AD3F|nr:pyridoxamine 5'-phosphate oxidase family protein [Herbaspirillum sp. meg3]ASU36987.1 flavin-nucleotide-binding protein [Herbaspirillum sp. meg3]